MEKMKTLGRKIKKSRVYLYLAMGISTIEAMILGIPVFADEIATDGVSKAGTLGQTKLVTGTQKLIKDALYVAAGLEAAICAFLVIKEFIAMQQGDEQDKPRHKKNIKTIVISGILVLTATSLISIIFGYYTN